ncbi:MAG: DUF3419 family protein [Planctomycetota bacterium]
MSTEADRRVDFSILRYAQVWEDADVLLAGLDVRPGDGCLSIASAGDNALALLTADPARVLAVDLNPAQRAALQLRMAAYRTLDHAELLRLLGAQPGDDRSKLYARCRPELDEDATRFWDAHPDLIKGGVAGGGRFERYFERFRKFMLPLVHRRATVRSLLEPREDEARRTFYDTHWNTKRWRWLFAVFFSRLVMGRLGRDPALFRYVEGSVAQRIFERAEHALRNLDPSANPYLHWILTGTHGEALPLAWRPEHFDTIRTRLDRVEVAVGTLEDVLDAQPAHSLNRFNLSDVFEYMSESNAEALLRRCVSRGTPGGRLAYWNMLVLRGRPESMAQSLRPLDAVAASLHRQDRAFFYSRFVVEELA